MCRALYWKGSAMARCSWARVRVTDRGTLGGLTQFATRFGFTGSTLACKLLILKTRREVRVVEGARLESEARERWPATPTRLNGHAIIDLAVRNDHSVCRRKPRCFSRS